MKKFKTIAMALFLAVGTVMTAQEKKIDVSKSTINWVGKKFSGDHSGTLSFESGTLVMRKGKVTGGNFTVDMTSLTVTDLQAGKGKEKLEGHLKNDDFFATDKHPKANLAFKTIAAKANDVYTVTADLTIKGITKPITFDMAVKGNTATADLKIDRSKYDIQYKSKSFFDNLGDNFIYDEFDVNVTLSF
jgi:polyisoprenoid-binding protein YceI